MRLTLARLELLSYGKTMSLASSTSPTCEEPGGGCPRGDLRLGENAPHVIMRARYEDCETDPQRLGVIIDARELYDAMTLRRVVVVHEETAQEWLSRVLAAQGWPAKDVAVSLRCSATEVRRLRTENGCDPETGELAVLDARALRSRGVSWRDIARLMGKSAGSIRYQLRER